MQTQSDIADLSGTIVPKSDQLNAEQLLSGPMTITIDDVRVGSSEEQPVTIHYAGENGRPYKPCKTCRKMLIFAWGADGRQWIGRSMTLYNDQLVRFGGAEVGGIRISHLSDIPKDINVSLTATRGKKAAHTIKRMERKSSKAPAPTYDWTPDDLERLERQAANGRDAAEMGKESKAKWWRSVENQAELTAYMERQRAGAKTSTAAAA